MQPALSNHSLQPVYISLDVCLFMRHDLLICSLQGRTLHLSVRHALCPDRGQSGSRIASLTCAFVSIVLCLY